MKKILNTIYKNTLNKAISNIETILLAMKKHRQQEIYDRCYALHFYPGEGYKVITKEEYINMFGKELEE